jgi:hypothetical protein
MTKPNPWTGTDKKAVGGRIEDWAVLSTGVVFGRIYDDPRGNVREGHDFLDGNFVVTSGIVRLDDSVGTLETKNTVYTLGKRGGKHE